MGDTITMKYECTGCKKIFTEKRSEGDKYSCAWCKYCNSIALPIKEVKDGT